MQTDHFVIGEIALIVEALQARAKRLEALAKWQSNEGNAKLSTKHGNKARAMLKLCNKLIQGGVRL